MTIARAFAATLMLALFAVGISSPETAAAAALPSIDRVSPGGGSSSGGTIVTITGQNFSGTTTVRFGSVDVPPSSVKRNQVIVVSPAHANGRVDVHVVTADGESTTSPVTGYLFHVQAVAPTWAGPDAIDPAHEGGLGAISCPDTTFCAAVDYDSAVVYEGGHWDPPVDIAPRRPGNGYASISCPAAGRCVAVGYNGQGPFFTYAAVLKKGTWRTSPIPGGGEGLAISCSTITDCWVVSYDGVLSHFANGTWTSSSLVGPADGMQSISCPSIRFCLAVGNDGNTAVFQSGQWQSTSRPVGTHNLWSASCVGESFCMVTSLDNQSYTYRNGVWASTTSARSPGGDGPDVSCSSAASCIAVAPDHRSWRWNGTRWRNGPTLPGDHAAYGVSCASSSTCVAGGDRQVWDWNGTAWADPQEVDYTQGHPNAVSCPAVDFCGLTDGEGNFDTRTAAGWINSFQVSPGDPSMRRVSCTSSTFCAALTDLFDVRTYDGAGWGPPIPTMTVQGSFAFAEALTCASPSFCVVLNNADYFAVFDGTSWSTAQHIAGNNGVFVSVSCPQAGWCMAVSTSGQAFEYADGSWQAGVQVAYGLSSVSCSSTGFCLAVGDATDAAVFKNGTWQRNDLPGSSGNASSVSCQTGATCVAVDGGGSAYYFDGWTWDAGTVIDTPQSGVVDVSCAADRVCTAATISGDVISTDG